MKSYKRMKTTLYILLAAVAFAALHGIAAAEDPLPPVLRNAHAHNDYEHERPLFDALDHGFLSVEVDIYLKDGALLVGHDPEDLEAGRTLESLYLEPLRKRVAAGAGKVYRVGPPLLLLVDIKTDAEPTYGRLRQVLRKYKDLLTEFGYHRVKYGAVTVILSGNRPIQIVSGEDPRYVGIDGRPEDLQRPGKALLMPLVSGRWGQYFSWRGEGPMPEEEKARLREMAERAIGFGHMLRFWATPESPAVWNELLDAGVTLINTDELDELQAFLIEKGRAIPQEEANPETASAVNHETP